MTEEALLAAARRGDHQAFARLLDLYERPLCALAYRMLGDREDMEDAMQEAAVKAFLNLGSFDGRSTFGTWLQRITFRTCLNALRTRRRFTGQADMDSVKEEPETWGSSPELADQRLDLEQALRSLSAEKRAAVCLVLELGFSLDEAAAIFEVPVGTVSSRLWHAREVLRRAIEPPATRRDRGRA